MHLPRPRFRSDQDAIRDVGRLIVLEGVDGSGKTAIRNHVASSLSDLGVVPQSSKEVAEAPDFARRSMLAVASLLWPTEDTSFDHQLPAEYWLHLQAIWYALES